MVNDPYTLIVALDNEEEACGSLYIDDTRTHNYKNGDFLYSTFSMLDDKLAYKLSNYIEIQNLVEKVMIVGAKKTPNSVQFESSQENIQAEFEVEGNVVVVKLPQIRVNQEWVLAFN